MPYQVKFSRNAVDHLKGFPAADRTLIIQTVVASLTHEPHVASRNRKLLLPNEVATWELRIGDYRVFYEVDQPNQLVEVRAVGIKHHNALKIGGKEVSL